MEELLVYALLLSEGFKVEENYNNRLDEMFLNDIDNELLIELEFMSSNIKESVLYIESHCDYRCFDYNIFGEVLMRNLKPFFTKMDLHDFANKTYALWSNLPSIIQHEYPFFALCYAGDPLSWGDEKQTRELYMSLLNHYESDDVDFL